MKKHARKTFTKIVPQETPVANASKFTPEHVTAPDDRDEAITRDLTAILEKSKPCSGRATESGST